MFIFRVISFYAFWKFLLWLGNSAWDLLGVKFWYRDFFGFRFLSPFDHPCHLKSGVPPPVLSEAEKLYKDAEFFTLSIPSESIFF